MTAIGSSGRFKKRTSSSRRVTWVRILKAALTQIGPELKPVGTALLGYAGSAGIGTLQFIAAVAVSGFLLLPGPSMVNSARMIFRRIAGRRGDEFVSLAGATVRSLARGVIGVSVLQALLVGIGLMVAGVPAAGLFSFLVLILGIVQIGPLIVTGPLVIWSWTTMDLGGALIFSAYMLPVTLLDNFLRPFVMAHGLKTPMLIILVGVIGGVLTHGVIGLFIGPLVLAIAWELLMAWAQEEPGVLQQR
jgi:predicted PurR-regulated permease PerM